MLWIAALLGTALIGSAVIIPSSDVEDTDDTDGSADSNPTLGDGDLLLDAALLDDPASDEEAELEEGSDAPEADLHAEADLFAALGVGEPGDLEDPQDQEPTLLPVDPNLVFLDLPDLDAAIAAIVPDGADEDTDGDGHAYDLGYGLTNGVGNAVNMSQGSDGTDTILGGATINYADGGEGDDVMVAGLDAAFYDGEAGDDTLYGKDGNDSLAGGSGDDLIRGGDGADQLSGGDGHNILDGGEGYDSLTGGADASLLYGGTGADTLLGGGDDTLIGGAGSDILRSTHGDASQTTTLIGTLLDQTASELVDLDTGSDLLSAGSANTTMIAGSGDMVSAGSAEDTVVLGDWIDGEAVDVHNFDVSQDSLMVVYDDSQNAGEPPTLQIAPHPEKPGFVILSMDGEAMAEIEGAAELAASHVQLVPLSQSGMQPA